MSPADRGDDGTDRTGSDSSGDAGGERRADTETSTGASEERRDRSGVSSDPADGRDPRDEPERVANEERRRNIAFVSALTAVVGAWVVASVFLYDVAGSILLNNVLVGALVVFAASYNYYRQYSGRPTSVGVSTLVALLGIWLIVAAVLFELLGGHLWNTAISGLLIAVLAGYNAYEMREARAVAGTPDSSE
ncbi:SPW repeat domain-containing protein [Natronobiforma cellulositropha]|uniref:SPW repeat domain-containing protein n=1 Tax=Natronobiforma cellulositropha TaxID=1679076 RepID=UPI0021D5F4C6|nr:hypothetical protein [Natronobiforma cellulositropha]